MLILLVKRDDTFTLTMFDWVYIHDDVIKWKHFPRYWLFVRGIHRSPVNSPHKGQWRGALMFSLICAKTNGWINNREAGDLRRHRVHYDVIVMETQKKVFCVLLQTKFWMYLCIKVSYFDAGVGISFLIIQVTISYICPCIDQATNLYLKQWWPSSLACVFHQASAR